jgi:signal transduction histidine kinase/CheY-like chemotaxis protein
MSDRLRRILAWVPLGLELTLGLAATLIVVRLLSQQERGAAQAEFVRRATLSTLTVEASLRQSVFALDALTGAIDGSPQFSRSEFDGIATALQRDAPAIYTIGWAPLIHAADRDAFEQELRAAGFPGARIRDRLSADVFVVAPSRDRYVPIQFIAPRVGKEALVGSDLAPDHALGALLAKTLRLGVPVATQRLSLMGQKPNNYGVLVVEPVFDAARALRGYVMGTFLIGAIVSRALEASDHNARVALFDRDAPPEGQLLYRRDVPDLDHDALVAAGGVATDLIIGTRHWSLVSVTKDDGPGGPSWNLIIVTFIGIVTTLNIAGYHATITRRRALIERQVSARTQELEDALARLRVSEQRFRGFLSTASDWYWEADTDYRFTYISERADDFGIPREELIGLDRLIDDDAEIDIAERQVVLARHMPFKGLRVFAGGTGGLVVINLDGMPVLDANGRFAGYRGSARNMTGAVKAEAAERSARAAAEQAGKSKSDFLANMSHEIRTPMNGVLGMAQILSRTTLDTNQRKSVDTILRSAENLLAVLNDILDYSKLEAGKITIEMIDCSLTDIIGDIISLMRPSAEEKGAQIITMFPPEAVPRVEGDPTRLRQILLNLLSNAVKFGGQGTIRVTLGVAPVTEGHVAVVISVSDHGIGMDRLTQKRLFTRFTQADTSSTRRFGGTGLGLAITRELAELMGGTISVQSEPGKGSRFTLNLRMPLSTGASTSEIEPAATDWHHLPPVRLKILVAEDDEINRSVIGGFLEPYGHQVTFAHDGEQAVRAARDGGFDIVLMDVMMPCMDGPTAARAIRAFDTPAREVPIIALTANAMAGHRERYIAAGMNDYVSKPVSWKQLAATIEQVLHVHAFANATEETASTNMALDGGAPDAAAATQFSDFVAMLDLGS